MGRKATFVATLVERVSKNQEKLRTSEVLNSDLLDVGLLDLVRKPVRTASGLVDHRNAASEVVNTLGATLSQFDVGVSTGCSLEGCTAGLLACKYLRRVLSVLHENEVFLSVCHLDYLRLTVLP